MTTMKNLVCALGTLLLFQPSSVDAFPSGAGACPSGRAVCEILCERKDTAVFGFHLDNTANGGPFMGTLAEGFRGLNISDTTYDDPSQDIELQTEVTYEIDAVVTGAGTEFKGALIRVECEDLEDIFLLPTGTAQLSERCEAPARGLTHSDRENKTALGGFIYAAYNNECTVDVTIVDSNNLVDGSVFWHSTFVVIFTGGQDAPTPSPTSTPSTQAPTKSPSQAPTAAPTTLIDSVLGILLFPFTLLQNFSAFILSLIFGDGTAEE